MVGKWSYGRRCGQTEGRGRREWTRWLRPRRPQICFPSAALRHHWLHCLSHTHVFRPATQLRSLLPSLHPTMPPAERTYFNVVSLARLLLPGRRGATDGGGIGERWARPPPPTATARPSLFLRRSSIAGYRQPPPPPPSQPVPRDGEGIARNGLFRTWDGWDLRKSSIRIATNLIHSEGRPRGTALSQCRATHQSLPLSFSRKRCANYIMMTATTDVQFGLVSARPLGRLGLPLGLVC